MPAHYGIVVIPDAHKNAMNAVFALWQSEDPSQSENISIALNASGSQNDAVTHWIGGRPYQEGELPILQNLAGNIPSASWPVTGASGAVTEQQAEDAATALYVLVGTAETYTVQLAQQTLASALGALGLQRVSYED